MGFADLDGERNQDFVAIGGNRGSNVWENNGNGTFAGRWPVNPSCASWNCGNSAYADSIADMDSDNADTDGDNGGVPDAYDAFPLDPIGDCDSAKSQGFWKSAFKKTAEGKTVGRKFDDASLLEFLTIVGFAIPTSTRRSPSALSLTPTAS